MPRAPALVETTLLRRKATAKLPGAHGWLFTDEALQQATAEPVAAHRAARLAGRVVHDATCSIGTELAALRQTASVVLGSDLDPVRLAMARHNVRRTSTLCRADALHPITNDAVVVVDPGRRSGGRRSFDPRDYTPALDQVLDTYRSRDLVVKCAPGIDFDALGRMGFAGEIEVTSWAGSVREACLWSPGLAEPGVRRRASVLDFGEQLTDADAHDSAVGRWAAGSSIRTARWFGPDWCGTTPPGTGCGNSTPRSPTCPAMPCRPACVDSRYSNSFRSARSG